jgi:hypothetical protein
MHTSIFCSNVRHAWLYESAVRSMRKKLKLSSDGGDSGSKKCKRGYSGAYDRVWRSLHLAGVRWSVLCWCVWQESGFSRREDVFTWNLLQKKNYEFCNFNAIFKDSAVIDYITIQHKEGSFPSILTGHTTLVIVYWPIASWVTPHL